MFDGTLQLEETPMSADVLQRLNQDGVLTIDAMADLFNIQPHSAYPYLMDREMRYSHLRTLCRRSCDARVAGAFYSDLMAGTGWSAIYIEADLDIDGDGDVDTDDVLGHAIKALGHLSHYLSEVQGGAEIDLRRLASLKQRVMQGVVTSQRAAAHIYHTKTRGRRKARPFSHQPSPIAHQTSSPGGV
jgi:hypothetical protein